MSAHWMSCNMCEPDSRFGAPHDFIGMALMEEHLHAEHGIEVEPHVDYVYKETPGDYDRD